MPAKRALKLDKPTMEKRPTTPLASSKKNLQPYSPTTGTCQMSPFSSPRSNNVQEHRNGLSNGKTSEPKDLIRSSRKIQPQTEASDIIKSAIKGHCSTNQNDKLLMLQSAVEDSLERFIHIRKNLTSLRALEGIRELKNIVGVSDNSGNLKEEVRKTRKLIEKARQQKLLRKSNLRFPTQGETLICLVEGCYLTERKTIITDISTALHSLNPSLTKVLKNIFCLLAVSTTA